MNTKIMNSLSSSLQDRRTILESKTRDPALRSAGENVTSRSGSPPGSKGDGLFERELSRQTERNERSTRPREDEKMQTAKTDKTENLRSHSGAGTDSRNSKTERRLARDQRAADRAMVRSESDRYSKENSTRESNRISEHESTPEVQNASSEESVRGKNLEDTRSADREETAGQEPQEVAVEESNGGESTPLRSRRFESTAKETAKSSQVNEAQHAVEESDDDSVDVDAASTLAAANQAQQPKSLKDPKSLKQIPIAGEAASAAGDATAPGKQAKTAGKQLTAQAQAEDGEGAKTDFTPKQKAMLELLQGMQKELGVSPETLLKAFGDMSTASLEAPPEQTLKEFIGKLTKEAQLTPRESVKATALYGKFLGEHSQAEFDETLDGLKIAGAIQDGSMGSAVLERLDRSVGQLQASLKGLQQGAQTPEELQAEVARLMQLSQALKGGKPDGEASVEASKSLLIANSVADSDVDGIDLNDSAGDSAGDSADDSLKDFTAQKDKSLQTAVAGRGLEQNLGGQTGQGGSSGGSFAGSQNGQQKSQHASGKTTSTSPQVGSTGAKGSLRGEMEQALKAMNGDDATAAGTNSSAASASTIPLGGKQSLTAFAGEGSALSAKTGTMSPKDEEANVKELMRQAQLIVKKGGGEMKLEMSPEGMGKVHLKVGVENGQVNVQMLAESDAAKKMLENNLGDLRASLVAHKLHVDQLKVDTKVEANADVSKQMDQQMRGDANRDQSRQSARDFMSEFREDREGFRQGFFGDPKGRAYARPSRSSVTPDAVSAMSARKTGATSRLNVVA